MLVLSDAAAQRVLAMIEEEGDSSLYMRVGVKGGGCTGLSYGMGFDSTVEETDQVLEIKGVPIVVDNESAPVLQGVNIDFKENMMGGGFTIDNPNAIASCGCGASFKTATKEGTPEKC
ncbi:iron-sulfur cluster assembly accessory protein [Marinococcus halophilus]|uniref:Core domain-containing protein n=1 Tax=Marinococcus halophilus TaxID=1371 RepID=A0A510Y831_MARHA|nr:iron-sulfur cluster assembly accessory protein [Marinococcus halophilus]OZT79434.1 iron-sulfur cluster assembly accessory protein [Marinococcus halophilus]GEK59516.1 hypothetical protein MHA01_24210 [Marinococcus halophilus]